MRAYAGGVTGPEQQPPYAPPSWDPQAQATPAWNPGYGPVPQPGQPVAPYRGPGPRETESKAVVALVCAIASWVALPLFPAIAALVVGSSARRDIDASGGRLTGEGLVTAARVIAWINLGLCALAAVVVVGILALAVGGAGFS